MNSCFCQGWKTASKRVLRVSNFSSSRPVFPKTIPPLLPSHTRSISTSSSPFQATAASAPSFFTAAISIGIACGGFYLLSPRTQIEEGPETVLVEQLTECERGPIQLVDSDSIRMALKISPGRVGNLTAEQEVKLQEFWSIVLKVFGVHKLADGDAEDSDTSRSQDTTPETAVKKKSKKRLGIFGKKKHADSSGENGSVVSKSHTESDDKYGQTKEFDHALASQTPEQLRNAFWSMVKHDHPDNLLLRFLRARKWDVEKALVMLISTMHWRAKEMRVDDDIVKRGDWGATEDALSTQAAVKKEGEDFLAQLRLGKSYLHGVDKEGRPMCFVRVRLHKQGEQSEASLERYTVYVIETARLLLSTPVDTANVVFDMTDFSMANMDYAPVKFMIKCFEANYPESLGVVLVHKAPWIFQGIWSIIKGWLDPVVASKIHFTKNIDDLEHFVERNHIPKELGGEEDWTYKYIEPIAGENAPMKDDATRDSLLGSRKNTVDAFETATQKWLAAGTGDKELQKERNSLAEQLRGGYWQLDPYLRARTFYDRTELIRDDGKIVFYEDKSTAAPASAPAPAQAPIASAPPQSNGQTQSNFVHNDDDID